ncbi:hypothetical protein M8312_05565 [Sphingomonas sp. KRR8]|uniref:DUF3617 domain-containing protein n=1 Tax=Sphingomonas sp. KRR8 TaxID=2942996 RepID=UPI0020224B2D|nr:hypothetical protein [Sphingomonas sp. KRR8]URD61975.1 hypothetical protein M8312_05565 [Sphingomonas sp. KRR8]
MRSFLPLLIGGLVASGTTFAALAGPLSSLEPGLWSVSRSATGSHAVNLCVKDFAALGQWEHRGSTCSRSIISQTGSDTVVRYSCPGGDFGQAKLTTLTPRSLRVETQGIHSGEPFHYELFARKSGTCGNH